MILGRLRTATAAPAVAPTRVRDAAVLAFVFAAYCLLALVVPPADDEFYYWCWTRPLQLSYYDHPPMTAYLIAAACGLFGDTLFAVRLPACVAGTVLFAVVRMLTRPATLAWRALFTPALSLGAVIVTPDTPLLLFWSLYLLWLVRAHERLALGRIPAWFWLLGGLVFGCGMLGKYTTALAGLSGLAAFALAAPPRKWAAGWVLHGAVAFAVASPILIYNIQLDFAPIKYQWAHTMGSPKPGLKPFAEFLGVQVVLVGTLPLAVLPWAFWNWKRLAADPRLRVCGCLFALPFAFFVFKSTRGPLEGNWALASYIGLWPVAGAFCEAVTHRPGLRHAAWAGFLVPWLVTAVAAVHLIRPLPFLPPAHDRITRQIAKEAVADELKRAADKLPFAFPIYTSSYQMAALMQFHGIDCHQLDGVTRPSVFTHRRKVAMGDDEWCYLLWDGIPKHEQTVGMKLVSVETVIPLVVRGETVAYYALCLYRRE